MATPDVLVFDLFGTLVRFDDSRVPTMEVGGRRVPMTIRDLPALVGEILPQVGVEAFLGELRRVSALVVETKKREGTELHTSVRFERTLLALGAGEGAAAAMARRMAAFHMDSLARAVVCPPGRVELLAGLSRAHRLALLSNFDDGATARRVLDEAGLTPFFDVIVISEEEGVRKPSRSIFERTCERLAVPAPSCLYIGDTLVEDIEGATSAGLSALWICADAAAHANPSPAVGVLEDVSGLPAWLAARRTR